MVTQLISEPIESKRIISFLGVDLALCKDLRPRQDISFAMRRMYENVFLILKKVPKIKFWIDARDCLNATGFEDYLTVREFSGVSFDNQGNRL
jgi:hypothetical protein